VQWTVHWYPDARRRTPKEAAISGVEPVQVEPPTVGVGVQIHGLHQGREAGAAGPSCSRPVSEARGRSVADAASGICVQVSGVDVVTFSGDKLLGGPQAGIIVGRRELVERIRANPLNRALRIDKLTLAGLEATLRLYLDEKLAVEHIPTLRMILMPAERVKQRARRLARLLKKAVPEKACFSVVPTVGRTGGGALPLADLPSFAVAVKVEGLSAEELHRKLRLGEPPVVGRIEEERFLLEVRTIFDEEFPWVAEALKKVVQGDGA